jgi:hypothetical protein
MLYNTLGAPIALGYVTRETCAGAPLILVGQSLQANDPRWLRAVDLATRRRAPLVGIGIMKSEADKLIVRLQILRKILGVNGDLSWYSKQSSDTLRTYPPCGPILVSAIGEDPSSTEAAAVAFARRCLRYNSQHLFGVGQYAMGPAVDDEHPTPPVYLFHNPDDALVAHLDLLWTGRAATLAQLEATQAVDATRPGFSRQTHPTLLGSLLY